MLSHHINDLPRMGTAWAGFIPQTSCNLFEGLDLTFVTRTTEVPVFRRPKNLEDSITETTPGPLTTPECERQGQSGGHLYPKLTCKVMVHILIH